MCSSCPRLLNRRTSPSTWERRRACMNWCGRQSRRILRWLLSFTAGRPRGTFPSRFWPFPKPKCRFNSSASAAPGHLRATAIATSHTSDSVSRRTFRIQERGACGHRSRSTGQSRLKRKLIQSAGPLSEISRWSISAWPIFSRRSESCRKATAC